MKSNQTTKFRKASICIASMMLTLPVLAQDNTDDELSDDILLLSPFEVEASSNVGYLATQTLAGTRIKTDLRDVGSAISVVTKEMLRDTGATDNATLLSYTTNTEVGGTSGNFAGTGDSSSYSENESLLRPNSNTRVRGLAAADNTRNFFLTEVPWDGYNVDRVDMQRGPNSILFGLGSPAGIINASTNQANFNGNHGNVEVKFDKEGSRRASFDYNHVILENELAVRVDALYDDTRFKQKPAYEKDQRFYTAVRYAPNFLQSEKVTTTIKANFEHGEIDANRPRQLPPMDLVTPWFTELNQAGYDPVAANAQPVDGEAGAAVETNSPQYEGGQLNPNYQPWITGAYADAYGGPVWVYNNNQSTTPDMIYLFNNMTNYGIGADGEIDNSISGLPFSRDPQIVGYSTYADAAHLSGSEVGAYKDKVLTNADLFDFYHILLDGDNKHEEQDFDTFNFSFSQTFFDNRFSYEMVYDKQEYHEMTESFLNSWNAAISVDIRTNLVDGSENPNFGRPYVFNRMTYNNNSTDIERENFRFTATAELRASDFFEKGSLIERIIGRHNFTGLYSKERNSSESRAWKRATINQPWGDFVGQAYMTNDHNDANTLVYIGDSMVGETMNQNLDGLDVQILPTNGQVYYFDSNWNSTVDPASWWDANSDGEIAYVVDDDGNVTDVIDASETQAENPANYVGWTTRDISVTTSDDATRESLLTSAMLVKDQVESKAFVWQAYLLDGLVVPTFGYREDKATNWTYDASNGDESRNADNSINVYSEYYKLPDEANNVVEGNTKSWSVVVHSPEFINRYLPWDMKLSAFYNTSENFQPAAGRVDILGNSIASPEGETKDYGFIVSALSGRVSLKVNWYETTVSNTSIQGGLGDAAWYLGGLEIWASKYASMTLYGEERFNGGDAWRWDWSQNMTDPRTGEIFESATAAREFGAYVSQLMLDNYPTSEFTQAWGIRDDLLEQFRTANYDFWDFTTSAPAGMAVTSDMKSEGVEFELFVQPTDNWSISINASKVEAKRYNLAGSIEEWILTRNAIFNSDAGYVRLWGASNSGTMMEEWNSQIMSAYNLFKLQENTSNAEVRPWRFNLITNYNFSEGFLSGFNIGGGVRWQDKNIIGYALTTDTETGGNIYDINSPYYGPSQTAFDLWMGYGMAVTEKIDWRIQFNIRNIFGKNELIPISTQPNGDWASARIAEPMAWSITNTFSF